MASTPHNAPFDRLETMRRAFPGLDEATVQALDAVAHRHAVPAGEVICREGEPGTTFFILGQGQVDVVSSSGDEEILLRRAQAPDYFGEMAVLSNTSRSATVRAATRCHIFTVSRTDFLAIADDTPSLLRCLFRQMSAHMRSDDRTIIEQLQQKNEALQAAYADLAERDRTRSELITTLAHELRTPLTSVQGFLHLINKGTITGDSLRVGLETITRNVEQMVWLVNNLLVLHEMHLISPHRTRLTPAEVVAEALREAQEMSRNDDIPISLDIAPDVPPISGDRPGLVLALRSLIDNALKFSPEQTPVAIRAYCPDDRPGHLRIDVVDQGVGIAPPDQDRIFEPFARIHEQENGHDNNHLYPGLGVGLSIARFIVNRHGGDIQVRSEPGRGSTFSVFLPVSSNQ